VADARKKPVYRVVFVNEGKVYELYARSVSSSALVGCVELEDLLFGEKSTVVVDPTEEKLRVEFEGVQRVHIPLHAIVRVDEVARRGTAKITALPGRGERPRTPPSLVVPGPKKDR
jgi:hypothetical protein